MISGASGNGGRTESTFTEELKDEVRLQARIDDKYVLA
jgi:hypothetical protein